MKAKSKQPTLPSYKGTPEEQKQQFIQQYLGRVPEAYQKLLGDDPARWLEEERQIRQQFAADFKAAGFKVADVGGCVGGGAVQTGRPGGETAGELLLRR